MRFVFHLATLVSTCFFGSDVLAVDVECSFSIASGSAMAGIPCVVELVVHNTTAETQKIWSQGDVLQYGRKYVWKSIGGNIEIGLDDFGVDPEERAESGPPPGIQIGANQVIKWHCAIPTPPTFGKGTKWQLEMVTMLGLKDRRTLCKEVITHDRVEVVPELAPNQQLQSTLLGVPNSTGVNYLTANNLWASIVNAAKGGNCQARLVLFANEVHNGSTSFATWKSLDDCAKEIRCLRNYLYMLRGTYSAKQLLGTAENRKKIAEATRNGEWFSEEIDKLADK